MHADLGSANTSASIVFNGTGRLIRRGYMKLRVCNPAEGWQHDLEHGGTQHAGERDFHVIGNDRRGVIATEAESVKRVPAPLTQPLWKEPARA
jgi:hypothetical protein